MKKVKRFAPKALSALLGLTIICSSVAVTAYSAGAETLNADENRVQTVEEKDGSNSSDSGTLSKNETVYVISDAEGTAKKIIVSDWIKNPDKKNKINDVSTLKNIENLKGDETYTIDKNNMCVWDAEGNDIYYQGTGSNEIPVDIKVTYSLDGKTISPKDLAGKSGKVKIHFDYTNKQYENVTINGKKGKIYVPFVMLTGIMLDNDKFRNVEVSNGKVINDGNHTAVAGFAFPGLQHDIDIEKDKFEIPESVEITADVKDFELSTTFTMAANDVFSNIDFADADDKVNEVSESLGDLTEATDKLIDGSSQLYSGISTLLNKSDILVSGLKTLANGAKELSDGSGVLDSGAKDLNSGAKMLDSGAKSLKSGSVKLKSGMSDLAKGLSLLSANSASLVSGAKEVFDTLLSTADAQIAAAGITADKLTISNYSKVLSDIQKSLDSDTVYELAYNTAYETVSSMVRAEESLIKSQVEAVIKQQVLESVIKGAGLGMTLDEYNSAVASGKVNQEVQSQIESAVKEQMNSNSIQSKVSEETEKKINELIDENMKSDDVKSQIESAVKAAKSGMNSITQLKTQLDSYNKFYQGIISYTSGVDSANSGAKQLLEGTKNLKKGTFDIKAGTKELKKGTGSLKNGTGSLLTGSGKLVKGIDKLVTGTDTLVGGVKKLENGSMTLTNGLKQYKREGVQSLVNAVDGDVKGLVKRFKAISEVSSNYKSYSGISQNMDGKTDFIYKTDSIEK